MLVRIKVINEPSHLPRRSIDWELPEKRGDRVSTTIFENALILRYHPPPPRKQTIKPKHVQSQRFLAQLV